MLSVPAENSINYWLGSSRPILFFRCKEKKLDAYIVTGTAAAVGDDPENLNSHRVRLRFDARKPIVEWWNGATNDEGLFSSSPKEFLRKTVSSQRLRFQFTPFNANPVVASFDVGGLQALAPRLAACR